MVIRLLLLAIWLRSVFICSRHYYSCASGLALLLLLLGYGASDFMDVNIRTVFEVARFRRTILGWQPSIDSS